MFTSQEIYAALSLGLPTDSTVTVDTKGMPQVIDRVAGDPQKLADAIRWNGLTNSPRKLFLVEANLSAKDARLNLQRAQLPGAWMEWARFCGTCLLEANLTAVSAFGTNFSRAIMTRACLVDATLIGANVKATKLHAADTRGADLRDLIFDQHTDFSHLIVNTRTRMTADLASHLGIELDDKGYVQKLIDPTCNPHHITIHPASPDRANPSRCRPHRGRPDGQRDPTVRGGGQWRRPHAASPR